MTAKKKRAHRSAEDREAESNASGTAGSAGSDVEQAQASLDAQEEETKGATDLAGSLSDDDLPPLNPVTEKPDTERGMLERKLRGRGIDPAHATAEGEQRSRHATGRAVDPSQETKVTVTPHKKMTRWVGDQKYHFEAGVEQEVPISVAASVGLGYAVRGEVKESESNPGHPQEGLVPPADPMHSGPTQQEREAAWAATGVKSGDEIIAEREEREGTDQGEGEE